VSARQLGLASNGRARRGPSSGTSPAATNVTMQNGTRSVDDMMAALGHGLLVTGFIGRGVNLVTGDYSRGINGFWFENGEIAYPVSEVTIAGNLSALFAALEPADDLEMRHQMNAPSLFLGEMTIAGA